MVFKVTKEYYQIINKYGEDERVADQTKL